MAMPLRGDRGSLAFGVRAAGGRVSGLLPVRALATGVVLLSLLAGLIGWSAGLGSYPVPLSDVFAVLTGAGSVDPQHALIVLEFRLPRTLTAALAGALFALSGTCLQAVTRNPLADPSLVGVSQGAGVAVLVLLIVFPGAAQGLAPALAMIGAFGVAGLMYALAGRDGASTVRFILSGIGVGAFLAAVSNLLITYGEVERVMGALVWLAGSVHAADWGEVRMLGLWLIALLPLTLGLSRGLNALLLGESVATGLGVALRPTLVLAVAVAVGAAAGAVAALGTLGFVGLVAPHIGRLLVGERQGMLLVVSALSGALLVTAADTLGRTAFAPVQIPAGIVTALIGVPYFLALLWQRRHTL